MGLYKNNLYEANCMKNNSSPHIFNNHAENMGRRVYLKGCHELTVLTG